MTMKLTRYVVTTSSFNYIEMVAPEMVTEFNQQDLTKDANNDNFKEDRVSTPRFIRNIFLRPYVEIC